MSDTFINHDAQRELAHRVDGGLEITLYWNAADDATSLEIFHPATETTLHVAVPRERALRRIQSSLRSPAADGRRRRLRSGISRVSGETARLP